MKEQPEKLNNQAILLASDGDYTGAIACFKRAILIEKQNELLWFNLGLTYRDCGDFKNAIDCLKKARQISPENEDTISALVEIHIELNLFEEAQQYALEGLKINECNANLWNLLGITFFKLEDYTNAADNFELALTLNPYFKDALYNLRDTYSELGNKAGEKECNARLKELR